MNRLIFLLLLVFVSCSSEPTKKYSIYPKEIDSLGLNAQYDDLKWKLYCNYCDIVVERCNGPIPDGLTFGMLPLTPDIEFAGRDTLHLWFFFNADTISCSTFGYTYNFIHGAAFNLKNDSFLYYLSPTFAGELQVWCDSNVKIEDCPNRIVSPLQPEVIRYINKNKDKLNTWFRNEAEKRGVLK